MEANLKKIGKFKVNWLYLLLLLVVVCGMVACRANDCACPP